MPTRLPDNALLYKYPDQLAEVKLNGVSVKALQLVEVKVWPDGWGYIQCKRDFNNPERPPKKWIDGQYRDYLYRGMIEVIA